MRPELLQPSPRPPSHDWPILRLQPVPVALPAAAGSLSGGGLSDTAGAQSAHRQTDHASLGGMGSASTPHIVASHTSSYYADTSHQPAPIPFANSSQALASGVPQHSLLVTSSCPSTSMWPIEPSPNLHQVQHRGTSVNRFDPVFYARTETYPPAGFSHSTRSNPLRDVYPNATSSTSALLVSSPVPSGLAAGRPSIDCGSFQPPPPHYSAAMVPWHVPGEEEQLGYGKVQQYRDMQEHMYLPEHLPDLQYPLMSRGAGMPSLGQPLSCDDHHHASPQPQCQELQYQHHHPHLSQQLLEQHNFEHSRRVGNHTSGHY